FCLFVSMTRLPSSSTLFPYTTLFRSKLGSNVFFNIGDLSRKFGIDQDSRHHAIIFVEQIGEVIETRLHSSLLERFIIGEEGSHRSEEHTSELQSRENLVCRLLLEKKK